MERSGLIAGISVAAQQAHFAAKCTEFRNLGGFEGGEKVWRRMCIGTVGRDPKRTSRRMETWSLRNTIKGRKYQKDGELPMMDVTVSRLPRGISRFWTCWWVA